MNAEQSPNRSGGSTCTEVPASECEEYVRKLSNDRLLQRRDEASDLIKLGGRVRILIGEREQAATSVDQLPDEPFEIVAVDFSGSDALSNETMAVLRGLHEVRELKLSGAPITGVGALRGMENLESLWLDGTRVKGVGLLQVQHLKSLRRLHLAGVEASDEEIRAIQEALPECLIQR